MVDTDKRLEADLARITEELDATRMRLKCLEATDTLTGLLNRRGLQDSILHALHGGQTEVPIVLVDVDDFRAFNDRLGQSVGDSILNTLAETMRNALPPSAHLGRVGGDEFVAVLDRVPWKEAWRHGESVRQAIASLRLAVLEGTTHVTATVSLATATGQRASLDHVLAVARQVLAECKASGKNRVGVETEPAMNVETVDSRSWADRLMDLDDFYAVRQPIMGLGENRCVGYELLSRTSLPSLEMPNDFFRESLRGGILGLVDQRCFASALRASRFVTGEERCHLNLFPSTLLSVPRDRLLEALPEDRSGRLYCVELSEQQILGDPSTLLPPVRELRARGLSVAIDDVGFGRTWLESLIVLEPEHVKIDRRCVTGVSGDRERRRQLTRMIAVLKGTGADVIAEGVESQEDLDFIVDAGIRFAQGYFFGKPAAFAGD